MPRIKAVLFDAFGTVLDTDSAMRRHAERLGPDWQQMSQDWRARTMEYTWVRSLAGGQYRPFSQLSRDALAVIAERHGIADPALLEAIAAANRTLDAYEDVAGALAGLRDAGIGRAILSNGERSGMMGQMRAAGLEDLLDDLLSADAVTTFKPDRRVYELGTARFGAPPEEIGFVSSNAWDAFGAHGFGYRVVWLNRTGKPDEYGLSAAVPGLRDLSGLPGLLA